MSLKNSILLVSLGIILFACCPDTEQQISANKALVIAFTEALNNADWAAFESLLTDDFHRYSDATPGAVIDSPEAFVNLQESFLASCPDQKITLEMLIGEGDKVAAYATYTGTQTGPFEPFLPKGLSMNSKFLSIFRIENGRIAELWVEYDNLAMLTQLGHFPPPGETNVDED